MIECFNVLVFGFLRFFSGELGVWSFFVNRCCIFVDLFRLNL